MPTKTVILECRQCELSGELGLVPQNMPQFDEASAAFDGVLVAHDLLEHVNGVEEIGGVGDECEALGAAWVSRGVHSDLSRSGHGSSYTPHQNIASDIQQNFQYWAQYDWAKPIPTQAAVPEFEDDLREILREGIKTSLAEAEYDDSDRAETRRNLAEFIRGARNFMRAGYLKMLAKYDGCKYAANSQFWAVAGAVEQYAKHCEFEGQQFELTYGDGEARCSEHYEDEEGDELSCDDCSEYFDPTDEDHENHDVNPNGYTRCGDCVRKEEDQ